MKNKQVSGTQELMTEYFVAKFDDLTNFTVGNFDPYLGFLCTYE